MAVTQWWRLAAGRTGGDDPLKTEYEKVFLVETDSNFDTWITIAADVACEPLGQAYEILDENGTIVESDPDAFLVKRDITQHEDDPLKWDVKFKYSTEQPDQDANPLNRNAEIDWKLVKYKKAVFKDVFGDTITNSAGEPFLPPREIELHYWRLTIVRNEAVFSSTSAEDYIDHVNLFAWYGWDDGTVKIVSIEPHLAHERGIYFWRVTYVLELKSNIDPISLVELGWQEQYLDQGKNELISGALVPVTAGGTGIIRDALLDGTGRKLGVGNTPVYITADLLDSVDFDPLNLPDPNALPI